MKKLYAILLMIMLVLQPVLSVAKPKTFLSKIKSDLKEQILINENRTFSPEIYIWDESNKIGWCGMVNNDYLRGVVTVFEAADLIPAKSPEIPFYETKEFGFIIGVLSTAVLVYLIK